MDFGSWSPSHTILALFIVVGFISQIGALFYRVSQTEKRLTRSEERAEKRDAALLAMIDKRIGEVNLRIDGLRVEMNQQEESLRSEMKQQGESLRSEMNQRLSDMDASIRQLNQNHIEHLTYHQHTESAAQ